jgi:hypothetical protein
MGKWARKEFKALRVRESAEHEPSFFLKLPEICHLVRAKIAKKRGPRSKTAERKARASPYMKQDRLN